jgi:hypothetical protein
MEHMDVLQGWNSRLIRLRCMRRNRPATVQGTDTSKPKLSCCVSGWYLRFSLSFRNLEELMAEAPRLVY